MDAWREFLYPLGFLSSLLFGARILVQWAASEKKKESVAPALFWQLSFFGNLSLLVHSLIQVQFHVFIIQVANAVISWRNLNLKKKEKSQIPLKYVITLLVTAITASTCLFFVFNDLKVQDFSEWFRAPTYFFNSGKMPIHFSWHLLGIIGLTCFSSRFWVQWISSERKKTSYLGPYFWWLSLIGDLLILVYFAKIKDPVNLIGPIFGLIPYIRNLMLIRKSKIKLDTA